MISGEDSSGDKSADNPGPFVVSHPCAVCRGQGCSACGGTGVARFFHGTKAALNTGDLIEPGHRANYGRLDRGTTYVYLTGTLDAATWGAELAHVAPRGVPQASFRSTGAVDGDESCFGHTRTGDRRATENSSQTRRRAARIASVHEAQLARW